MHPNCSVPDGGFRNLQLSYPSPHHVHCDFTLQSFRDIQFIIITDRQKISFSASVIEGILETPGGDYRDKGFQTMLEVPEVKKMDNPDIGFLILK
jgi:hypothetical protein